MHRGSVYQLNAYTIVFYHAISLSVAFICVIAPCARLSKNLCANDSAHRTPR